MNENFTIDLYFHWLEPICAPVKKVTCKYAADYYIDLHKLGKISAKYFGI